MQHTVHCKRVFVVIKLFNIVANDLRQQNLLAVAELSGNGTRVPRFDSWFPFNDSTLGFYREFFSKEIDYIWFKTSSIDKSLEWYCE